MRNPGAGFGKDAQFFVIEMYTMRIPNVVTRPAEPLHVLQRTNAFPLQHVMLFVLRLAQMRVQSDAILTREDCALTQQFR